MAPDLNERRADGSVRGLLATAMERLAGEDAAAEAAILLAHVLARPRSWLLAWPEHEPTTDECARFAALVEARARGEPVAYLIGRRGFWTFELEVTPAVLIPRPETERLVELALARLPAERQARVADLGTGSGAIALALASERPRAQVVASDASSAALELARRNARRLGLERVAFVEGDWCAALGARMFDLIASNPPYIAAADPHLARGDLRFEPAAALASGADGLDALRSIVAQARFHLGEGGWLLLEHGHDQGAAVRSLLAAGYREIGTERDHAGHERVTFARR